MMNDNPFIEMENEDWKRKYIGSPMGNKIRILPRVTSQADLRRVYNQVDCGVFPSHAEGWNLEILEAMACGGDVIATNYSGHTEFLNNSNSYLIQPQGLEVATGDRWFHGQGEWCKFDVDELVQLMRTYHNNNQNSSLSSKKLKVTADLYSWQNTIKIMENVL